MLVGGSAGSVTLICSTNGPVDHLRQRDRDEYDGDQLAQSELVNLHSVFKLS